MIVLPNVAGNGLADPRPARWPPPKASGPPAPAATKPPLAGQLQTIADGLAGTLASDDKTFVTSLGN